MFCAVAMLASCNPTFRMRHTLEVTKSGFVFDGKKTDSAIVADSLAPFCADKANRHLWKLTAPDTSLKASDFVGFLSWIAKINTDCRGAFGIDDNDPPTLMQPPVPAPRSIYSINTHDTIRPRLSLMVVAERSRVRIWTEEDWMPEIPVLRDTKGNDWVGSEKNPGQIRISWRDGWGRCAIDPRGDHCTDSLWPKSKYVMLGNLVKIPDTIRTDDPDDMEGVVRAPLPRDVAVAAQIHAVRTLPGTIPDSRAYFHGVFDPDMSWASTMRLILGLRKAGVDFNTVELFK